MAAVVGYAVNEWLEADPPPTGDVSVIGVTRNVSREMFYGRATEVQPGELEGLQIQVARDAESTRPRGCRLVWTVLDADGPTPVTDPSLRAQPAADVHGDPQSCTTAADLWVPLKLSLGNYTAIAVQVDLLHQGEKLDSATTERVDLG